MEEKDVSRSECADPFFCPWDCFFEKWEDDGVMEMNDQWSPIRSILGVGHATKVGRGFLLLWCFSSDQADFGRRWMTSLVLLCKCNWLETGPVRACPTARQKCVEGVC